VKLVNFVRKSAQSLEAATVVQQVHAAAGSPDSSAWPWSDDSFLLPVLPDDPLLYSLGAPTDGADDPSPPSDVSSARPGGAAAGEEAPGAAASNAETGVLLATIAQMRTEMVTLLGLDDRPGVSGTGAAVAELSGGSSAVALPPVPGPLPPAPSGAASSTTHDARAPSSAREGQYGSAEGPNSDYFASYAKLGIHEDMLGDRVRREGSPFLSSSKSSAEHL
jgi:hypothetical protein